MVTKKVLITDLNNLRLDITKACYIIEIVNLTKEIFEDTVQMIFGDEKFNWNLKL
ncbi:MAG: hypothetical protein ABI045_03995 [Flavobacteriales bacterium]